MNKYIVLFGERWLLDRLDSWFNHKQIIKIINFLLRKIVLLLSLLELISFDLFDFTLIINVIRGY